MRLSPQAGAVENGVLVGKGLGGKCGCQHIKMCAEMTAETAAQRVVGTGLGVGTTFSFHALDSVVAPPIDVRG